MKIDSLTGYGDFARDIQEIIISEDQIQMRVQELGAQISNDYRGKCPVLVGVLKGVLFYMADLLRVITIPSEVDFLAVSSYSSEARTQGVVRLVKDLEIPINHRHVLFVEDVIDTGLTLNYLLRSLREREPESLEVCVLFNKPGRRIIDIPLKYKGFDLPDRFVVGYGLDHQERYRNLPFIGLLKAEAFQNPHHLRECE
ncbi:MAG: hypoxanthine phosphoribosyltransferase [Chloroflexi bacterium GWB2_54_36]|nr:MAG: hypoxanthine phosphoribosyltransferase [Chloroflexi bacterium GWB2_54_36]HBA92594.1 hypoxanthine phosphoribosyltransferase [Anaerolineaceae bacterium]